MLPDGWPVAFLLLMGRLCQGSWEPSSLSSVWTKPRGVLEGFTIWGEDSVLYFAREAKASADQPQLPLQADLCQTHRD